MNACDSIVHKSNSFDMWEVCQNRHRLMPIECIAMEHERSDIWRNVRCIALLQEMSVELHIATVDRVE